MDQSTHALSEQELFMREFINSYKQQPVLWQQSHPQYRNRGERTEAYNILAQKCQQYYPEADEDFVRMKIDSMRSTFRKERRKVLQSRENTNNLDDIYKPNLWYYDLLLFTAGEEAEGDGNLGESDEISLNPENGSAVKIPFWTREYSAILINCYKNYPCLYTTSHPHYRSKKRRVEALQKITDKLISSTGKRFNIEDVRRKIALLRGQFRFEHKKVKRSLTSDGEEYKPTLWCFELLNFLSDEYPNKRKISAKKTDLHMRLRRKTRSKHLSSEDSDDALDIKKESDSSLSSESVHLDFKQSVENDDIFDTIAKNLAHKLREMTEEQRSIANRIIRDVMYHGQMENLSSESKLSLDGS